MKKHNHKGSAKAPKTISLTRPMQGIDEKKFILNDIIPLNFVAPSNDAQYTVTISADANGYTWAIVRDNSSIVAGGSNLYGSLTDQFAVQSMMYTQYFTHGIKLELSLSQGGNTYSFTPVVEFVNPSGAEAFVAASDIRALIASPQNTQIHMPYAKRTSHLDFGRWMMSMQQRAWRQTRLQDGTRELYNTDAGTAADPLNRTLPTLVKAFQFTVPAGTFDAGAPRFTVGFVKIATQYVFSQRRTNIQDLVDARLEDVRIQERKALQEQAPAAATAARSQYPDLTVESLSARRG